MFYISEEYRHKDKRVSQIYIASLNFGFDEYLILCADWLASGEYYTEKLYGIKHN